MGYDFPRVNVECNFIKVLELDALFRLRLTVGKLGRTSNRYEFRSSTSLMNWLFKVR
jgi:acyl-CoA thioesterase FadM